MRRVKNSPMVHRWYTRLLGESERGVEEVPRSLLLTFARLSALLNT